jgi:hypothetical protein
MRYKIVQIVDGHMIVTQPTDIFAWAAAAGVDVIKLNDNPRHRAELQGQPVLSRFCGPMWDCNNTIRYEDQAANDRLSL